MAWYRNLLLKESKSLKMKTLNIILIVAILGLTASCRKANRGRISGFWEAVSYTIDGVEQDLSGKILIEFDWDEGGVWKNYVVTPNGSGYLESSKFEFLLVSNNKRLIVFYDNGYKQEFEIKKFRALPTFLDYEDEETAKEEYMILTRDKEEFKFVKQFEP